MLLCLWLVRWLQAGCELTTVHLRQPAGFASSREGGREGGEGRGGNLTSSQATDDLQSWDSAAGLHEPQGERGPNISLKQALKLCYTLQSHCELQRELHAHTDPEQINSTG